MCVGFRSFLFVCVVLVCVKSLFKDPLPIIIRQLLIIPSEVFICKNDTSLKSKQAFEFICKRNIFCVEKNTALNSFKLALVHGL